MPLALEGHPVAVEHIVPASCMRALCRPPHKVNSLLFLHELLFLSPPRVETHVHVRANPRRSLPPSRSLARPRAPRSRPAAGPASSGLSAARALATPDRPRDESQHGLDRVESGTVPDIAARLPRRVFSKAWLTMV